MKPAKWDPSLFQKPCTKDDPEYPQNPGEPLWVNLANGNHIDICNDCGRRKEIPSRGTCRTCTGIRRERGWL